ncbi:MAG: tyrosine-type recombinase/integrase [Terracidiphilus sp.]
MPAGLFRAQTGRRPCCENGKSPSTAGLYLLTGTASRTWGTSIKRLRRDVCAPKVKGKRRQIFPADFVLHSLRHTMLTGLGESGVDAFALKRIAGHSSIVVSQRYIQSTPKAVERAFERLELSGGFGAIEPNRLPPAAVSATLTRAAAVNHRWACSSTVRAGDS